MNKNLKIVFMGTPEFGAIILEGLIKNNYKPILVVTSPDKPVGRKQILTPSPVKIIAEKNEIPVAQPERILNLKSEILNLNPDLIVVAAYGQILPKEILEIPKYGSLNVHPSLLPKYQGASPIQAAILNGDKETGVTIFLMDEKIDHGKIVSSIKYQVSSKMTYGELSKKLADLGAELLIKTIPEWVKREIKPVPQDESKATYTKILRKEDGKIDWKKSAEEIERQIRAFESWPGTFTSLKSKILKILKSEVSPLQILSPAKRGEGEEEAKLLRPKKQSGEVFLTEDGKLAVQTGNGCLIIEKLQLEGGKQLEAKEFLKGHPDFIGKILK